MLGADLAVLGALGLFERRFGSDLALLGAAWGLGWACCCGRGFGFL